jgi:uncharacterized protein (DUF488 family)
MSKPRIVTIGVYGYGEGEFFHALQDAGVDTFCDVRRRRAVRGAAYAFANSRRLQTRLEELGIRYIHRIDLSPSNAARAVQYAADDAKKIGKRQRDVLAPAFAAAYEREVLAEFSPEAFLAGLPEDAKVVALFCVERAPEACHRSLLAARLAEALGLDVEHVR